MNRQLEIYGTLGPSCADPAILRQMFEKGITGMRLNLSHGTLSDSEDLIAAFHKASAEVFGNGKRPSLLIDMQGPELRIGTVSGKKVLGDGMEVRLCPKGSGQTGAGAIPVPGEIFDNYRNGMILMIDDGKIRLRAMEQGRAAEGPWIRASVLTGGTLLSRKSIAVEGMTITGSTLTEQDLWNLSKAESYGVTDVMQPFVRGALDLTAVRSAMQKAGAGNCRLFAKIENRQGLAALDEILSGADMLVIARGDLGNAVPLWELPRVQKEIAGKCLRRDVPFMVVTQMLASMEKAPMPTRAEVSDIFNAVADGASAVMITGESASGRYPVEASDYLVRTAQEALRWKSGGSGPGR